MRSLPLSLAVLLALLASGLDTRPADAAAPDVPDVVSSFGGFGTDPGQMNGPDGVDVDDAGNVYVTDKLNHRVQKFDAAGNFLDEWGSFGTGLVEFDGPGGLALDGSGNVYVTEVGNHRIQKFSDTGTHLSTYGTMGSGESEFNEPRDVAVTADGSTVYVADSFNHRIQMFSDTGLFLDEFGSQGSGPGQLDTPTGIAISDAGRVYVVERNNHRVQEFTSDGTPVTSWGTQGSGSGQLHFPWTADIDAAGNLYVTEIGNDRVQMFSADGVPLGTWGGNGTGAGQFIGPLGIALDASNDYVYVSDHDNDRVQRFFWPDPRPDARIRRGAGALVGNDIYNTTGVGQARNGSARRGRTVSYSISVENDTSASRVFRLTGQRSTRNFTVRYRMGATNVTQQVVAGTYLTPTLGAGDLHTVRATVTVKNRAPRHARLTRALTVIDTTDTTRRDSVRFTTRRRR